MLFYVLGFAAKDADGMCLLLFLCSLLLVFPRINGKLRLTMENKVYSL